MKSVAVMLTGILMMSCATGRKPVVTYTQIPLNQYEIDRKKKPVITYRELSGKQFEITVKSGSERFWEGCLEFSKYGDKLCKEKTGKSFFRTKKTELDTRSYNAIWTQVRIIECRGGFWEKKHGDKSERQRDFYECSKDVHLVFDKRIASSNPCELIELGEQYWDFFEFCLRAKGYEFVEGGEGIDPKIAVPQSSSGGNWDFLVESKTGDSKLYLDWDSYRRDYYQDDVTFRLKTEYTNGDYTILTFKYYCIRKKYVVVHGATYNRKGELIVDRSKWDDIPKTIPEEKNIMGTLYEILCGPILNRKKEK